MKPVIKATYLLFAFAVSLVVLSFAPRTSGGASIYDIPVKDIDGGIIDLKIYRGKKMMFTNVSGNEHDSTIKQYAAFYRRYKDSAVMILIPSREDGYVETAKEAIKKRFARKGMAFVITEPMNTHKTSGPQQSELMQWLSNKKMNSHYDNDITGPGFKFFVDEYGELYGIINSVPPLTHPIFERIMGRPQKKVEKKIAPAVTAN